MADQRADAYDRLIDRLLASPHYGERWGRHWLDLARFAESHGYEQDYDRPTAYHYRDFVIQALNEDMPYDRFVKLQIAGDEFEPDNNLALMATGFLAAGAHATQITANQVEKERYDELDDMAATVGTAMLGLTVGCARCHDHKFDPIPQADYYRLVSTFTTTVRSEVELDFHPEEYREAKAAFDREHAPLAEALAKFEARAAARPVRRVAGQGRQAGRAEVADRRSRRAPSPTAARRSPGRTTDRIWPAARTPSHDVYTFVVATKAQGHHGGAARSAGRRVAAQERAGPGRQRQFRPVRFSTVGRAAGHARPRRAGEAGQSPRPRSSKRACRSPRRSTTTRRRAWAVDPQVGKDHAASFELETPVATTQGHDAHVHPEVREQHRPQPGPRAAGAEHRRQAGRAWTANEVAEQRSRRGQPGAGHAGRAERTDEQRARAAGLVSRRTTPTGRSCNAAVAGASEAGAQARVDQGADRQRRAAGHPACTRKGPTFSRRRSFSSGAI